MSEVTVRPDEAEDILQRFLARTPRSRQHHEEAQDYLPAGSTRTSTYFLPYPVYMEGGEGCSVFDADENAYLDFHNNYTSLIHGHTHPLVQQAIQDVLARGSARGAPTTLILRHAQMLHRRMPSLDLVRYCNSGTEATMFAIRAARAFTGKDVIVKIDGAYHGTHDTVEVNVWADPATPCPVPHIQSRGVPASVLDHVAVVPFNDLAAMDEVLTRRQGQVAAVIAEPLMNGAGEIPPQPGYLKGLRALCDRHGVLLIFDEVVTFRLSEGGYQQIEGIRADLTALGKIIGGGFAVGAFGGRKDIMSMFDSGRPDAMSHSGTFNAGDVVMAAGLATVESYGPDEIARVNRLGERLRAGLNQAFRDAGVVGQAIGEGSLATLHWRAGEIRNAHDAAVGVSRSGDLHQLLHLEMMNRGIFFPRRGQLCISTVMNDAHVDTVVREFAATLSLLKPYVAEVTPHLLAHPAPA